MQRTSTNGKDFIKKWEQFRDTAYLPHKDDVWTIAWGHTDGVYPGMTCTRAEGEMWFMSDIFPCEEAVNKYVKVPLSQAQFDVLVSFIFNCGTGAFRKSTLLRELNKGHYDAVPGQLMRWINSGGKPMRGLKRRRAAEAEMWDSLDEAEEYIPQTVDVPTGRSMVSLAKGSRTVKSAGLLGGVSMGGIIEHVSQAKELSSLIGWTEGALIVAVIGCGYLVWLRWSDSNNGRAY